MNTALARAPSLQFDDGDESFPAGGAEGLLAPARTRPLYAAYGAAVGFYALALAFAAHQAANPAPTPTPAENPIELTMLPFAPPEPTAQEPPPPEPQAAEEPPPEPAPQIAEEPPPPAAEEPAVAPVEPPPVVKPKPKPAPKPKPVAAREPAPQRSPAPARGVVGAPAQANAPAGALASSYANQVHARISRAAAAFVPREALARRESGRVVYRLVISPSGAVISQSISSSGNAAFDQAARQALSRAAPFPASGLGRPAALSGAIVFR